MVARPTEIMPDKAKRLLHELIGQPCILQRVGGSRSLHLGFGKIENSGTVPHAHAEFGTYDCAWRVCNGDKVLCASDDAVDEEDELSVCLSGIDFGNFAALNAVSQFDVRIHFSTGIFVDILCTISDDDEVLHVFFPNKEMLTFRPVEGWRLGKSDQPWI